MSSNCQKWRVLTWWCVMTSSNWLVVDAHVSSYHRRACRPGYSENFLRNFSEISSQLLWNFCEISLQNFYRHISNSQSWISSFFNYSLKFRRNIELRTMTSSQFQQGYRFSTSYYRTIVASWSSSNLGRDARICGITPYFIYFDDEDVTYLSTSRFYLQGYLTYQSCTVNFRRIFVWI